MVQLKALVLDGNTPATYGKVRQGTSSPGVRTRFGDCFTCQ